MVMRHYRPTIINSLILLIIALCFGSTFLFIYLSLADFNPLATGSGRIIVAGICSIVFLYASGNKLPNTFELWFYAAIYGIFCLTIPFILIPFALRNLTTGEVAIYLSSIPLFILVLAKFILKEKISAKRWLGFFIGVLGLIFLVISSQNSTIDFSSNLLSALLCILASILLATGGILIQKMPKYSPISLTGASLTVASIKSIPIFLINVPEDISQPIPLIGLLGVGIFSTFLGNTLRFILIKNKCCFYFDKWLPCPHYCKYFGNSIVNRTNNFWHHFVLFNNYLRSFYRSRYGQAYLQIGDEGQKNIAVS